MSRASTLECASNHCFRPVQHCTDRVAFLETLATIGTESRTMGRKSRDCETRPLARPAQCRVAPPVPQPLAATGPACSRLVVHGPRASAPTAQQQQAEVEEEIRRTGDDLIRGFHAAPTPPADAPPKRGQDVPTRPAPRRAGRKLPGTVERRRSSDGAAGKSEPTETKRARGLPLARVVWCGSSVGSVTGDLLPPGPWTHRHPRSVRRPGAGPSAAGGPSVRPSWSRPRGASPPRTG